jgi:CBS domain-containing protein
MAAQEMEKHNAGSLVVNDREDRILGMVTDWDIALAIGRQKAPETPVERISSHSSSTSDPKPIPTTSSHSWGPRACGACRSPTTEGVPSAW